MVFLIESSSSTGGGARYRRPTMRKIPACALVVLAAAGVFEACGSSDSSTSNSDHPDGAVSIFGEGARELTKRMRLLRRLPPAKVEFSWPPSYVINPRSTEPRARSPLGLLVVHLRRRRSPPGRGVIDGRADDDAALLLRRAGSIAQDVLLHREADLVDACTVAIDSAADASGHW